MGQKKVMIVDDERDIVDLLAGMLEIRFNVTRAYSGINALEQLQREKQGPISSCLTSSCRIWMAGMCLRG